MDLCTLCEVCKQTFRNPYRLPCGHTFCRRPCLLPTPSSLQARCIHCHTEFPVSELKRNYEMEERVQKRRQEESRLVVCYLCRNLYEQCSVCLHCHQQLCQPCFNEHIDELQEKFRKNIQRLKNEADQLKQAKETIGLLRSTRQYRREELFTKIDGASHDLLSACRTVFSREKRQLDLIETHLQEKIAIILSNKRLEEMAVNLLRNVNILADNMNAQTLCAVREMTLSAAKMLPNIASVDPTRGLHTFEDYTLSESLYDIIVDLRSLHLLVHPTSSTIVIGAEINLPASPVRQAFSMPGTTAGLNAVKMNAAFDKDNGNLRHRYSRLEMLYFKSLNESTFTRRPPSFLSRSTRHMQRILAKHRQHLQKQQDLQNQPCGWPQPLDSLPKVSAAQQENRKPDGGEHVELLSARDTTHNRTHQNATSEQSCTTSINPIQQQQQHEPKRKSKGEELLERRKLRKANLDVLLQNHHNIALSQNALDLFVKPRKRHITDKHIQDHFASFGEVIHILKRGKVAYIAIKLAGDPTQILTKQHIVNGNMLEVTKCPSCNGIGNKSVGTYRNVVPEQTSTSSVNPIQQQQQQQLKHTNKKLEKQERKRLRKAQRELALQNHHNIASSQNVFDLLVKIRRLTITDEHLEDHFASFGEVVHMLRRHGGAYIAIKMSGDPAQILANRHIINRNMMKVRKCPSCYGQGNKSVGDSNDGSAQGTTKRSNV